MKILSIAVIYSQAQSALITVHAGLIFLGRGGREGEAWVACLGGGVRTSRGMPSFGFTWPSCKSLHSVLHDRHVNPYVAVV